MGMVEFLADRFRSSISPEMVRSRAFWATVSAVARMHLGRPGRNPDAAAMLKAIDSTRDAYLGRGPVVWANLLVPSEMLYGAGVIGFYPEVAAAVLTIGGVS